MPLTQEYPIHFLIEEQYPKNPENYIIVRIEGFWRLYIISKENLVMNFIINVAKEIMVLEKDFRNLFNSFSLSSLTQRVSTNFQNLEIQFINNINNSSNRI